MKKENIVRKLTSRKFWIAVASFITALLVAFHVSDGSVSQVTAIVMAFGSMISYIFAEGWTDAAHSVDKKTDEEEW